jgi:hypothetical protein
LLFNEPNAKDARYPGLSRSTGRDDRWIVFGTADPGIAPAVPGGEPLVYLATPFRESTGRFSPNGR